MKRILLILLVICLGFSAGCLSDRSSNNNAAENNENGENLSNPAQSADITLSDAETESIVREVLGEMLFRELSIEALQAITDDMSPKSVNTGFEATVSEIDNNLSVESSGGSAIIETHGTLETIVSYGGSGSVYYYSPLYIDIFLSSYKTESDELGTIAVNGNISCEFDGRFSEPAESITGTGACSTGFPEEAAAITMNYNGATLEIIYNVTFSAYGNPLELSSYKFTGEFKINGDIVDITSILSEE